eukprot:11518-Pelagococcus_subviridis.AAC.1
MPFNSTPDVPFNAFQRPQGVLRRSESPAAAQEAENPQRVGHRAAEGPEPRDANGRPRGADRPGVRGRERRRRVAREVQPAHQRDVARCVLLTLVTGPRTTALAW